MNSNRWAQYVALALLAGFTVGLLTAVLMVGVMYREYGVFCRETVKQGITIIDFIDLTPKLYEDMPTYGNKWREPK